jgi:hypothetical protein
MSEQITQEIIDKVLAKKQKQNERQKNGEKQINKR